MENYALKTLNITLFFMRNNVTYKLIDFYLMKDRGRVNRQYFKCHAIRFIGSSVVFRIKFSICSNQLKIVSW